MTKILGLTEEEILVALKNVGCHIETCGACAEVFYSGSTSLSHECGKENFDEVRIVFTGPPGPESGRFVEVEDADGRSVSVGTWRELEGGMWSLDGLFAVVAARPKQTALSPEQTEAIHKAVDDALEHLIGPPLPDIQDSTVTFLTGFALGYFQKFNKPIPPPELIEQEILRMRKAAQDAATDIDLNK